MMECSENGVCCFFEEGQEQYALRLETEPTDVFYLTVRYDNPIDSASIMGYVAESDNPSETLMDLLESGVVFQ